MYIEATCVSDLLAGFMIEKRAVLCIQEYELLHKWKNPLENSITQL